MGKEEHEDPLGVFRTWLSAYDPISQQGNEGKIARLGIIEVCSDPKKV
jgi:hypothetical protein